MMGNGAGGNDALGLDAGVGNLFDAQAIFSRNFDAPIKSIKGAPTVGIAMDASIQEVKRFASTTGVVPLQTLNWYSQFGFIGWQICAILSQQWLIDKAIRMPGLDATRNGFERTTGTDDSVDDTVLDDLKKLDKKFKLQKNLHEHIRFARMFGIRHTLFQVDGINYELPFNPDGVRKGSYKGMVQIDPYWLAPYLDTEDASNPIDQHFYEPTYWMVNGRKYHRSHFVISRNGADLPDILKPAYYYGGIPTTQLIYERVYAAERVANESPMLAMSKRLFALRTDLTKAAGNLTAFKEKIRKWSDFMTNFGIKVIGQGEEIQLHDTSLADLDAVIMNQYQLVAAAAHVPATKLLGTSPKGFNATGDYEIDSYHEFLETIQNEALTPVVERHTMLCQLSEGIAVDTNFEIAWNPLEVLGDKEQAEVNEIKARTDETYSNMSALDGLDVRRRLIKDHNSGYTGIKEVVPDGPGDREAQQEADAPLEQDVNAPAKKAEDKLDVYPVEYNGARIISHQSYLNPAIVKQKIRDKDYLVNVTPEFMGEDGKAYRMVLDGHHSLAAAIQQNVQPIFEERLPTGVVKE